MPADSFPEVEFKLEYQSEEIFGATLRAIDQLGTQLALRDFEAFPRWFAEMYFDHPAEFRGVDGAYDGKVDLFFQTTHGAAVRYHVINAKFTRDYGSMAPPAFYEELTWLGNAFIGDKGFQARYIENVVRKSERGRFKELFDQYRHGNVDLIFLTNHRRNAERAGAIEGFDVPIEMFHLDDIIQFVVDDFEDAMPMTQDLKLTDVDQPLTPSKSASAVPTSIVFAKLADFQRYMHVDPRDLLFARNIRLVLKNSLVNEQIQKTFLHAPHEFAFTHNGITILCDSRAWTEDRVLTIKNPRVVNGSQTLHSIAHLDESPIARVMVRVIQVERVAANEPVVEAERKKLIIDKIATRSNSQNPIKTANLRANDSFQHGLARMFRRHKLFYQRRAGEWDRRRSELKQIGIARGPKMEHVAQLIASCERERPGLGPAAAKNSVDKLFDDVPYGELRKVDPDVVYQLHLLDAAIDEARAALGKKSTYRAMIKTIGRHSELAVIALVAKAVDALRVWGADSFTQWLERDPDIEKIVRMVLVSLYSSYKIEAREYKKTKQKELTANNFFKSSRYLDSIVASEIPSAWLLEVKRYRIAPKRVA